MNRSDKKFLLVLVIVVCVMFISMLFYQNKKPKNALVYYEDELVLTIDLTNQEVKEYVVDGLLGKVVIEAKDGKVRVKEENSPNHICSKQGYIKESYEVLVCLPNKVVIKIEEQSNIDTVVK